MRIRTLGPADLDPVRRLCAVSLPRDQYPDQVPLILTRLDHAAFVAEVGREVVGCCIGSKSRHGAPGDCHLDLIIVDSRHRRKGIGRALFEHLESGFLAVGCTTLKIEGNAPSYAWAGVDVHYTSGLCFVERMGFARGRCAVNMSVDLSSVALDTEESRAGLAADGISVRPAEESDEGALRPWRDDGRLGGLSSSCLRCMNPTAGCSSPRRADPASDFAVTASIGSKKSGRYGLIRIDVGSGSPPCFSDFAAVPNGIWACSGRSCSGQGRSRTSPTYWELRSAVHSSSLRRS